MTRDELRELRAQALHERWAGGRITWEKLREDRKDSYRTLAEATMKAEEAAGIASVPLEATEAMIQHAHCHSFISNKINAAIDVGNLLKGDG